MYFWLAQGRETYRCVACGSREVIGRGSTVRCFHALPIGSRPVHLVLAVPTVACHSCQAVRQVAIDFARPRLSDTKSFARYVLELSPMMTILDIARHLGVGWDLVKQIQKTDLQHRYARPKWKHLQRIGIDEISISGGRRYRTVVLDLDSGRIVYVGDGKSANALNAFWKRLRASHARIKAVAMDMSGAYAAAVRDHLPHATIVFDHFHLVKLFNDKLSDLRRDVHREATDLMHKKVLKGTRWLLLKNPENLDDSRNEWQRLQEALQLNTPLTTAYYMKEDLRQIWQQQDKATATRVFNDWVQRAEASGVRMLHQFAKTLRIHRNGILAWYDHPISTGPLEGTNRKIRTLQYRAYRDDDFFKLKLLSLHESTYALLNT